MTGEHTPVHTLKPRCSRFVQQQGNPQASVQCRGVATWWTVKDGVNRPDPVRALCRRHAEEEMKNA